MSGVNATLFFTIGHSNRSLEEFAELLLHILGKGQIKSADLSDGAVIHSDKTATYPIDR